MPERPSLAVAIFSYNRGEYLKNCVDSVRHNIPFAEITIYDDRSDDPNTVSYLAECGVRVELNDRVSSERHGNLYRNMQRAVEECRADLLLFLQEDTQVVRPLDTASVLLIASEMTGSESAFIRVSFFWGANEKGKKDLLTVDQGTRVYHVDPKSPACGLYQYYVDLSLCIPERLRQMKWKFANSEPENARQAKAFFAPMPVLVDPFVCQCPEVPAYRDRRLFAASALIQRDRKGEIVRFEPMTAEEVSDFIVRSPSDQPLAERWLRTNIADVRRPFVHTDYSRSRWLTVLYKVESRLWRMWKPFRRLFRR